MNGLAICAGYGGLELAASRVFTSYRTVCYVEGEAYAASRIVERIQGGLMDEAPIWSDVRTFPCGSFVGRVDILMGGFPCQPHSKAGKLRAFDDPRNLWPSIVELVGVLRPSLLFFENVSNIINTALGTILIDLTRLGYDATWEIVRATEVGAPHQRERWFLLAKLWNAPSLRCLDVQSGTEESGRGGIKAWTLDRTGLDSYGETPPETNTKRALQYHNGGPAENWDIEPGVGRLVDGSSNWVDKIRLLGNGVVPQQAEYALRLLIDRLEGIK